MPMAAVSMASLVLIRYCASATDCRTRDGDGALCAALTILTVGNTNHRTTDLPNFGNFGASLSDDATDEFVGNSHLLCLLRGACCGSNAGSVGSAPQLTSS